MHNTSTNSWGCLLKEYTILNRKFKLLVPVILALATGSAEVNAGLYTSGTSLESLTVFSNTYTTTGDAAIVYGNMLVGDVVTTGANAGVTGNIDSVNAANVGGGVATVGGNVTSGGVMTLGGATGGSTTGPSVTGSITSTGASTIGAYSYVGGDMLTGDVATTGDSATVGGDLLAGGAATVGANSTITGNLGAVGLITISASGKVGSSSIITSPALPGVRTSVIPEADAVSTIQGTMDALGTGTTLAATMTVNTTLNAGIYSAPSLSTTASTILFLDAQGNDGAEWVFNIVDILHIGAFYNIQIINEGTAKNSSVVWNTGGYANIGASSNFIGTIFANTYIMVGANATVTGNGENCAGVYSATSYVSTGSDAVIDGRGCSTTPIPVDEPFGLLLSGLAALGFVTRRKIQAVRAS